MVVFTDIADDDCAGCRLMAQLAAVPTQFGHAVVVDGASISQRDGAGVASRTFLATDLRIANLLNQTCLS